jgi:hypothetical protein
VLFGKVPNWPCDIFIIIFTSVQLSSQERQDSQLSGGKKQNEASLSGSNFTIFFIKQTLFGNKKKSRTVMSTVGPVFAYNSRTDRDISTFPTDLDSAGQNQFSNVQNPLKIRLHC